MLNAFELENSIRELAEYISVYGISCSFFSNVSGEISAEKTIALFKFIGIFIRHIMNCTDALLFNLKVHDRFIDLKINCDSKNEMKILMIYLTILQNSAEMSPRNMTLTRCLCLFVCKAEVMTYDIHP